MYYMLKYSTGGGKAAPQHCTKKKPQQNQLEKTNEPWPHAIIPHCNLGQHTATIFHGEAQRGDFFFCEILDLKPDSLVPLLITNHRTTSAFPYALHVQPNKCSKINTGESQMN